MAEHTRIRPSSGIFNSVSRGVMNRGINGAERAEETVWEARAGVWTVCKTGYKCSVTLRTPSGPPP
jgi:hypothetical protein